MEEFGRERPRHDPRRPSHAPTQTRRRRRSRTGCDWLDANRETWLATAAQGDYIADPDLQALVDAARERSIDTLSADYADALSDDRATRLMLRNWLGFNRASSRSWLNGDATRAETALFLGETLRHLITTVAPKLKQLAANDGHKQA